MKSKFPKAAITISLGLFFLWLWGSVISAQEPKKTDPWERIRFLSGNWQGTAEGQSGIGIVQRVYSFVLADRFLYEKNITTSPPQETNKKGEVHEHWSFFSYDRSKKLLILRQFHQEGFVNQYALNEVESSGDKIVFDSEGFENFNNRWKARESYQVLSPDEFIEIFELAAPESPFEVYSKSHFKRVRN